MNVMTNSIQERSVTQKRYMVGCKDGNITKRCVYRCVEASTSGGLSETTSKVLTRKVELLREPIKETQQIVGCF